MIVSFGDGATEDLYHARPSSRARRFPSDVRPSAIRRLDALHAAKELRDLRSPPANRLEALSGNLVGYHSIRVNDQWRITFRWTPLGPANVRLVDYH